MHLNIPTVVSVAITERSSDRASSGTADPRITRDVPHAEPAGLQARAKRQKRPSSTTTNTMPGIRDIAAKATRTVVQPCRPEPRARSPAVRSPETDHKFKIEQETRFLTSPRRQATRGHTEGETY